MPSWRFCARSGSTGQLRCARRVTFSSGRSTTGYTTALKLLQIMTEKGLVQCDESQRTHVYRASRSEGQTQRQLVGDLLRCAFGGSALKLVMQAIATKKASAAELAEIRELIEDLEREKKGGDS